MSSEPRVWLLHRAWNLMLPTEGVEMVDKGHVWQELPLRSTTDLQASAAGISQGTMNSLQGPSARSSTGPENVLGHPFDGVAGASNQAPSDHQPDLPITDAEPAQPSEV